MLNVLSAIKKAKIGNVPRMGLRLVTKLQKNPTSDKFWLDYIDYVRNPENYRKLNPHSKCLLTCVFTKLDKNLIRKSSPDELIKTIYFDTINANCIDVLNLESINMLLVSSYTLGIPLTNHQLDLILSRINEDITNVGMFKEFKNDVNRELARIGTGVEDFVGILHSLASFSNQFPNHVKRISESEVIKNYVDNIESILSLVNIREFSMVFFAFDKLKLLNQHFSNQFYDYAKNMIDEFDYQSMSTIFYICSNNPNLRNLFDLIKNKVDSIVESTISYIDNDTNTSTDTNYQLQLLTKGVEQFTGRDTCSIFCSLVRQNCFEDRHYRFLIQKLNEMNTMELCNITSLLIKSNYPLGTEFKNAFVDKLMNSNLDNVVVLDALTVAHCLYKWSIQNELLLDKLVFTISTNGNFLFNDKSVLLLHYLVQLNFTNVNTLLKLFYDQYSLINNNNYSTNNNINLTPSQLIMFYNSLITLKKLGDSKGNTNNTNNNININTNNNNGEYNIDMDLLNEFIDKIEPRLLEYNFQKLSRMDLFTLAKSSNPQILDKLFDYIGYNPSKYLGILLNVIKHNNNSSNISNINNNSNTNININNHTNNTNIINRINYLVGKLDIESFVDKDFGDLSISISKVEKVLKLNELMNLVAELNNIELLSKIVKITNLNKNSYFEIMLNVLNSCKKLRLLNSDVKCLMTNMIDSFDRDQTDLSSLSSLSSSGTLSALSSQNGKYNQEKIFQKLDELTYDKTLISDLVGVLYHLDYFNQSEQFDNNLTRLLDSFKLDEIYTFSDKPNNTNSNSNINLNISTNNTNNSNDSNTNNNKYNNKNNNNCTIDERELYESFLFSSSSLCFNAVIKNKILIKLIKLYLSNYDNYSAIVLKCLNMNKIELEEFSLEELKKLKNLEFNESKVKYKVEDNEIHTSLFSTLPKLNYKSVPEYQIMDYRVDLLIK